MRTRTIEQTVFTFAELSEAAQDKARQDYGLWLWEAGIMQEYCQDAFAHYIGEELGWENAGDLTYSLYSQGGEPCFRADIPALEVGGQTFYVMLRPHHYGGGSYGFRANVEPGDGFDEPEYGTPEWDAYLALVQRVEAVALERAGDASAELLRRFYTEDDYQTSAEQVGESAEANGYEYFADGSLA